MSISEITKITNVYWMLKVVYGNSDSNFIVGCMEADVFNDENK